MNKLERKLFSILMMAVALLWGGEHAFAQNNTSSPYSMFGIGTTDLLGNGRNVAMGGSGIALRSNDYINMANPASYTALDSMRFYYDLGARGGYTWAKSTTESNELIDGNFSALSIATRITDRWYVGFGVLPKSNIGYNITTYKDIEGTTSEYPTFWEGSGGITQVVLNNGVKLADWVSVGASGSLLFGPLSSSKQIVFQTPASTEYTSFTNDINYVGVQGTLGAQFMKSFESVGTFTLGLTYDFETVLKGKEEELILHSSSKNGYVDTLSYSRNERADVTIPQAFGVGIAYLNPKQNLTLTADYRLTKWKGTEKSENYRDQHIISGGAEYVANPESRSYKDRIRYRAGVRYDTGYLVFQGDTHVEDYRASLGLGLPVGRFGNMINIAVEGGTRGTTDKRLVKENYIQGTVSFSLSQFWYGQRKYD